MYSYVIKYGQGSWCSKDLSVEWTLQCSFLPCQIWLKGLQCLSPVDCLWQQPWDQCKDTLASTERYNDCCQHDSVMGVVVLCKFYCIIIISAVYIQHISYCCHPAAGHYQSHGNQPGECQVVLMQPMTVVDQKLGEDPAHTRYFPAFQEHCLTLKCALYNCNKIYTCA